MHLIVASLADFNRTRAAFEFAQNDFNREVRVTASVFSAVKRISQQ
jgi:hypothetical protein